MPDPVYNEVLVSKFVNGIMHRGKRGLAEKIFYGAMDIMKERSDKDPLEVLHTAVSNVSPVLEVKSRRIGGATYQVPIEVRLVRRQALAIRWLVSYAKERQGKTMAEKLASELLAASDGEGAAMKKRQDTHRMAEANKAFAHFRY